MHGYIYIYIHTYLFSCVFIHLYNAMLCYTDSYCVAAAMSHLVRYVTPCFITTCTCICMCVYIYIYAYMYLWVCLSFTATCCLLSVYPHIVYSYIYTYMHIGVHTHIMSVTVHHVTDVIRYIHKQVYIGICVYIYIYIEICVCYRRVVYS